MPDADATLEEIDGRPALRFERVLGHSPERVWRSLTEPDEEAAWHPTPARIAPEVGGRVEFLEGGDVPGMPDGVVTEYEPPRLLAYIWDREGGDLLRWELRPHDDGCLLTLVHRFDDRFKAARDGAGWHLCLESLAEALDDGSAAGAGNDNEPELKRLNSLYQERFGISPEQATPPPSTE